MSAITRRSAITALAALPVATLPAIFVAGSLPDAEIIALGEVFTVGLKRNAELERDFRLLVGDDDGERTPEANEAYHAWNGHCVQLHALFERICAAPMPTTLAGFAVMAKATLFDLTDYRAELCLPEYDSPRDDFRRMADLVRAMENANA